MNRVSARFAAVLILLMMFGLSLTSMTGKTPTFDEQGFIVRGLGYLRGYPHIRVGHPIGINAINASFLANDETVDLPLNHPSWNGTSFHRPAELFLWEIGNDVNHIMFLSRLPTIWLGLLLAALCGRWAWKVSRQVWPGLLAITFIALDPNILAHTRLATTDLGLAAFSFLAGYTLWRFLKKPSWPAIITAGIALGLLFNTKFTAGLFIPFFGIVIIIGFGVLWADKRRLEQKRGSMLSTFPWRVALLILFVYPITALLALWATNGFDVGPMPSNLPMLPFLSGRTLPLPHYFEQLLDIGGRLDVSTPSFLLGQYSDNGWWYYFPTAFLLKTPVPTLILILWGGIVFVWSLFQLGNKSRARLSVLDVSALLVPAAGYFVVALTTDINLGYRHLLPVLPFIIVFSLVSIFNSLLWIDKSKTTFAGVGLAAGLLAATFFIYPDFLAYFNIIAGGPDNGWRLLVDSNLDWGQDLDELAPWMEENGVSEVWLSYFGEARPEYYGIDYQGLDSFPPRLMNPDARPFFPDDPAPGTYAISATNLQGVLFDNHDQFAWFRGRDPLAKLGYSIFLYQVDPNGPPTNVILSGIQLDELSADDFKQFRSNDVHPRWVDISQAIIIPDNGSSWLITGTGDDVNPLFEPFIGSLEIMNDEKSGYHIYQVSPPRLQGSAIEKFHSEYGQVQILDEVILPGDDETIDFITVWKQDELSHPVKFFIHALDQDGELVAQWDGLGVAWEGWQESDYLVQYHEIELPQGRNLEEFHFILGVYDPISGQRWTTDLGQEFIELE